MEESFKNTSLLTERLPKSDSGTFESISPVDGLPRLFAYRAVPNLPLIVLVTATIPVAGVFTFSRIFFVRDLTLAMRQASHG